MGNEWISVNNVEIVEVDDGVKLNNHELKTVASDTATEDDATECFVVGNQVIKAGTQRLIKCKLKQELQLTGEQVGLFEGKAVTNYGCMIAKSAHSLTSNIFFCNVMNTSNTHVRFKDNGVVGRMSMGVLAAEAEEVAYCANIQSVDKGKQVRWDENTLGRTEELVIGVHRFF